MNAFARPFHLHLRDGQVLDGAVFPSGHAIIIDDPQVGFGSTAPTLDQLLLCYHRARIEWPGNGEAPPVGSPLHAVVTDAIRDCPSAVPEDITTAVVRCLLPGDRITAALARDYEATVQRTTALYEGWMKAGPPPLGTSVARWWDQRLVELRAALLPPSDDTEMVACPSCLGAPPIPRQDLAIHNHQHHPHHTHARTDHPTEQ
ncbi:hypothetical protein [Streptomyces sp. NBRC 110035]|uniref:hypothetical protein n=1 Tax=Streptomyces sp. NBRC 110035 TaxID=1547867 RepID=UPI0005A6B1BD|nr:hypothetical protein [Streptomyces sp. NBRC 110035]